MNARNEKLTYTAIPSDERKPYWNVFVGPYQVALDCQKADAKFIADAFNMRGETGLTPRQLADALKEEKFERQQVCAALTREVIKTEKLADQRAELLAVCQRVFEYVAAVAADGDIDEEAKPLYEALRAAIARTTGEQP